MNRVRVDLVASHSKGIPMRIRPTSILHTVTANVPVSSFRSTITTARSFTSTSSTMTNQTHRKALTIDNINPAVRNVEYAVRGELALKADQYMQQIQASGSSGLPFEKVVTANIGNPQQKGLDQQPITYWRQVISLLEYPDLLDHESAKQIYPADVLDRARSLHEEIGSVGAYSQSKGVLAIRKRVAKFLQGESTDSCFPLHVCAELLQRHGKQDAALRGAKHADACSLLVERDGHPADPESIYLTAGASGGVSSILSVALRPGDGCLIPIPQYPLYTATLAYLSATPIPYYLQEQSAWSMSHDDLVTAISKAKADGTPIKAMAIINPGNPTGACLPLDAMKAVIQLCYDEGIMLLADEVYQYNIFDPDNKPFISFKKVLRDFPPEIADAVELVSFHSISKGVSGECGRRGGYFEAVNISHDVMEQIYKMASVSLCPPITGQVSDSLLSSLLSTRPSPGLGPDSNWVTIPSPSIPVPSLLALPSRFPAQDHISPLSLAPVPLHTCVPTMKRIGDMTNACNKSGRRRPPRLASSTRLRILPLMARTDHHNAIQLETTFGIHGTAIQRFARHVVRTRRRGHVPLAENRDAQTGRRRGGKEGQKGRCHVHFGSSW